MLWALDSHLCSTTGSLPLHAENVSRQKAAQVSTSDVPVFSIGSWPTVHRHADQSLACS